MVLELRSHQSGWMRRWPYNRHRNTCAESSERGKPSRNPLQTAAYRINRRLSIYSPEHGFLSSTVAASVPRQTLRGEPTDDSPPTYVLWSGSYPFRPNRFRRSSWSIVCFILDAISAASSRMRPPISAAVVLSRSPTTCAFPFSCSRVSCPARGASRIPNPTPTSVPIISPATNPTRSDIPISSFPLNMLTLCSILYGPSDPAHSPASREPPVGISANRSVDGTLDVARALVLKQGLY